MSLAQPQTLDRLTDALCALALAFGWASEFFQNQLLYPRARLALANLPRVNDALGTAELRGNLCRSKSLNGFGELHAQSQKKNCTMCKKKIAHDCTVCSVVRMTINEYLWNCSDESLVKTAELIIGSDKYMLSLHEACAIIREYNAKTGRCCPPL